MPGRFHASERGALRNPPRWHRLAYIARVLPSTLQRLIRELGPTPGCRVLDYGCADQPYRQFFPPDADFVGADLPGNPAAVVQIDPDGTLPLPDSGFDFVLSTQVIEHVDDPSVYLSECFRLLRPGGWLVLSTHGLMIYHPDPVDLWRWTPEGLRRAVGGAGFDVVRVEGIMGLAATGLQFVQDATLHRLPIRLRPLVAFAMQALVSIADRLDRGETRDLNALVFAVVARKPSCSEPAEHSR
jgi:SAM-dependent methyltransferase